MDEILYFGDYQKYNQVRAARKLIQRMNINIQSSPNGHVVSEMFFCRDEFAPDKFPINGVGKVTFTEIANGLAIKGNSLIGFEFAGQDLKFHPVDVQIDGATIVLSSAAVGSRVVALGG